MEKKTIPLDYIRGLLIAQGGMCAITGLPLDPHEVNADHIVPLSREELGPTAAADNIWLVYKKVNAMKGTMTYHEFVEMCRAVLSHHEETGRLLGQIQARAIRPVQKQEFDRWIEDHCGKDGRIRSGQPLAVNRAKPSS